MSRRRFAIALAISVSASGVIGAQQQSATALVNDPEANAQLMSIVSSARDAGLPIEPIVSKVQYAVVVAHAPAPRIVAAARAIAARLEVARDALMPQPSGLEIAAGADALGAPGVEPKQLRAVRAASPRQSVVVPLGVLAQLVSSGVSSSDATQIVTDLIKHGVSPRQLVALGNDVNSDIAHGETAAKALDIRWRGLNAVLAPGGGASAAAANAPGLSATGPKKP